METFNDIIAGDKLVLVDFFATWCQPCKMMHPVLEEAKRILGDKIRILKVDIDKHNDTAAHYQVQAVPTLILFRKGEVLHRQSGAISRAELMTLLDPFVK